MRSRVQQCLANSGVLFGFVGVSDVMLLCVSASHRVCRWEHAQSDSHVYISRLFSSRGDAVGFRATPEGRG